MGLPSLQHKYSMTLHVFFEASADGTGWGKAVTELHGWTAGRGCLTAIRMAHLVLQATLGEAEEFPFPNPGPTLAWLWLRTSLRPSPEDAIASFTRLPEDPGALEIGGAESSAPIAASPCEEDLLPGAEGCWSTSFVVSALGRLKEKLPASSPRTGIL